MADTLKEIKYKGSSVLVEAAKRDKNGNYIDTTYAKVADTYTKTEITSLLSTVSSGSSSLSVSTPTELPSTATANTICIVNGNSYIEKNNAWVALIKLKTINGNSLFGEGNITISGGTGTTVTGITAYADLQDKPSINSISLSGNKTASELNLQQLITATNKLSADLIAESDTHKFVSPTEKTTWNSKAEVSAIPTKTSQLANDSNFITLADVSSISSGASYTRPYTTNASGSLKDKVETGDYEFTSTTDSPTESTGVLKVDAHDQKIYQQWETANSISKRTITYDQSNYTFANNLHVTGTVYGAWNASANSSRGGWSVSQTIDQTYTSGAAVELQAGGSYTLSGTYNGQIKIVDNNNTFAADTVVELAGVKLKYAASEQPVILYNQETKKLILVLKNGTYNYIINEQETAGTTKLSNAVIQSYNDLTISGTGGLTITSNTGAHGIKADKFVLGGGYPLVNINALHDGIHGSKLVNIQNGELLIENGNDGIESKNNDNSEGRVIITGGKIVIRNCEENAISAKISGVICNCNILATENGAGISNTISVLEDTVVSGLNVTKKTFSEYYGTGKVKYVIEDPNNEDHYIDDVPNSEDLAEVSMSQYNFDGATTFTDNMRVVNYDAAQCYTPPIIYVTGYIEEPIALIAFKQAQPPITWCKFKIILDNAYIKTSLNMPTIHAYGPDPDITVITNNNTVNYVINTCSTGTNDHDAIKSEGDLRLSGDGTIIAKSTLGDGYDASKFEIKGDGARYALTCGECGIKGTAIYFGGDKDASSKSCSSNIYAIGNNTVNNYSTDENNYFPGADIYARNGKVTKGVYVIYAGYLGYAYTGTFKSPDLVYTRTGSGEGAAATVNVTTVADKSSIYYATDNLGGTKYWYAKAVNVFDKANLAGSIKIVNINKTILSTLKEKICGAWSIYRSLPAFPTNTTNTYTLQLSNGSLSWVVSGNATPTIPANAAVDEDGAQLVDEDNNILVIE